MGTYACQATNQVGSTQKQILLAGLPFHYLGSQSQHETIKLLPLKYAKHGLKELQQKIIYLVELFFCFIFVISLYIVTLI